MALWSVYIKINDKKLFYRFLIFFALSASLVSCSLFDNNRSDRHTQVASDIFRSHNSSSLDFFILSDWGYNGSVNQKDVESEMDLIARLVNPEFVLTGGDNFQTNGVSSTDDPLWHSNFENVYNDSALLVPWYPALGNRDYLGNADAQVEYTSISKYWTMPARYYTFVKNLNPNISARFIVLDTYGLLSDYQNLSDTTKFNTIAQYSWLEKLLSGVKEKWIIVIGHHPVFSASLFHREDSKLMKKLIKPLLDRYDTDLYISGHDHDFEHAREDGNPTDYFVTGTGGFPTPVGSDKTTLYSVSTLGFLFVSVSISDAKVYFITSGDKIEYSFKKTK